MVNTFRIFLLFFTWLFLVTSSAFAGGMYISQKNTTDSNTITVSLIDRLYELVDEVDPDPLEQPISMARTNKRKRLYAIAEDVFLRLNQNDALIALTDPTTDDATINKHLQLIRPIFKARCLKASLCSR